MNFDELDEKFRPVYASEEDGQIRLVLTTWMLLDRITGCAEAASELLHEIECQNIGLQLRHGIPQNPVADRAHELRFELDRLRRLLWRDGLWSDSSPTAARAADGAPFHVLSAPFTLGGALAESSRPLPAHAWERAVFGITTPGKTLAHATITLRTAERKAA